MFSLFVVLLFLDEFGAGVAWAAERQGEVGAEPDLGYQHDRWRTEPVDIERTFAAYTLSFDSNDDDNGDGVPDAWGIPHWVAQEIRAWTSGDCIPTTVRPGWVSDKMLVRQGVAPTDNSYQYPRDWRTKNPDWFERGHLAMKLLAERLGAAAARETFTLLNAVPQRPRFNAVIWQDLELLTGAWAQHYGRIWIVTGPVIRDMTPLAYLGRSGTFPVAIPDALFKIVIKEAGEGAPEPVDVLAFIYPQVGAQYLARSEKADHARFLTSVDEVELLTGLDFLTSLPDSVEERIEASIASEIWEFGGEADLVPACQRTVFADQRP